MPRAVCGPKKKRPHVCKEHSIMASKKTEAKIDQVKGRVREAVGKVTGKKSTELKGKAERAKGNIKEKLG
jgi:uncharacterized protein YjbJ (UPF0337 family)